MGRGVKDTPNPGARGVGVADLGGKYFVVGTDKRYYVNYRDLITFIISTIRRSLRKYFTFDPVRSY